MPVVQAMQQRVNDVLLSPGGSYLAVAGYDGMVQVYESRRFSCLRMLKVGEPAYSLAFSPEGRYLLAATEQVVMGWDVLTWQTAFAYEGHRGPVLGVACSPNGRWIASAGADGTVQVWDTQMLASRLVYRGHGAAVEALCWSPNSKYLASIGQDQHLRVWHALSGDPLFTQPRAKCVCKSLAWSPIGSCLAVAIASYEQGELDHALEIWDVETGVLALSYPVPGYGRKVQWHGTDTLALGLLEGPIIFASFRRRAPLLLGAITEGTTLLTSMSLNASGELLATGHYDGRVVLRSLGKFLHHAGHGNDAEYQTPPTLPAMPALSGYGAVPSRTNYQISEAIYHSVKTFMAQAARLEKGVPVAAH
jgi:WD40 repeat protein